MQNNDIEIIKKSTSKKYGTYSRPNKTNRNKRRILDFTQIIDVLNSACTKYNIHL
jgi:hypothetical protein